MDLSGRYLCWAAALGFLSVGLGAFGAHALRASLDHATMSIYSTAVDYQMWHALALALVANLMRWDPASAILRWTARLFCCGTALFSGSLFLLCITGVRWLGAITPFGGTLFLIGWGLLFYYSFKRGNSD